MNVFVLMQKAGYDVSGELLWGTEIVGLYLSEEVAEEAKKGCESLQPSYSFVVEVHEVKG